MTEAQRRLERTEACTGGWEAHQDHLDLNGECPWCGDLTPEMAKQLGEPEFGNGASGSTVATAEGVVIAQQRHIDLTEGMEA